MIIIKELTPAYYDDFMNYLNEIPLTQPFTLDNKHPIWIILDNSVVKGFLSISVYGEDFASLDYLMTDKDEILKDSLMRAVFNKLNKQSVEWIICHETFYDQHFPFKNNFSPIESNKELLEIVRKHFCKDPISKFYYLKSSIIYENGCRGGNLRQ